MDLLLRSILRKASINYCIYPLIDLFIVSDITQLKNYMYKPFLNSILHTIVTTIVYYNY